MDPRPRPARLPLAAALAAGVALGAAGAVVVPRLASPPAAPARAIAPPPLPSDPVAYVPTGVRGALVADVAALRAAPSLRDRIARVGGTGEPCDARLLRRVRRVVVALPSDGLADFALAFAGDLPRDELLACARARGGDRAEPARARYRGVDLVRVAPHRDPALLPAAGAAEIAYLPGGVVLAGASETVRRMIDRGAAPAVSDEDSALAELRRRLGGAHQVELAYHAPAGRMLGSQDRAAFRHVAGVAVGATFGDGLDAVAVVACDDFDAPRAVADALEAIRRDLESQFGGGALAAALRRATIERRAADVRVRVRLDAPELDALLGALEALAQDMARDDDEPAPAAVTDAGADARTARRQPDARSD